MIVPFLLEEWFREFFFESPIVLCSSGVEEYTLGELLAIRGGITAESLLGIKLEDSPSHGAPALRAAIAKRWGDGNPDEVMVTHGSSEAIYLAMHALVNQGDEVIVLTPCYQSLFSVAEGFGCHMKRWELRFENGYRPDLAELKRLATKRLKLIVVNFPHNPTGATISETELRELVDVAESSGAYLLWDGAFTELVYEGKPLPDPRRWSKRVVSTGTLSKAYGLPGLRAGWCIADPDILARCVRLRDYITLNLSPLTEHLALLAVECSDKLLARRLPQVRDNLAYLTTWLAERASRLHWYPPVGGVSSFLRVDEPDVDGFCRRLAKDQGVFLLPGSCFGRERDLRLGFGGTGEQFREGLRRVGVFLDDVTSAR